MHSLNQLPQRSVLSLLVALSLIVVCHGACSSSSDCSSSFQCCSGQCYDPSTAACVMNQFGQSVLCGDQHLPATTPDGACGSICFDTATYGCCNSTNALFQLSSGNSGCPQPASTPAPTGSSACSSASDCASGLDCCDSQCYNASLASCVTSNTGQTVLCGFQHLPATTPDAACGTTCYDTLSYGCCDTDSQIYLLSMASSCPSAATTSAPTVPATTSAPATASNPTQTVGTTGGSSCEDVQCGTGLDCCNGQCYNPGTASCVTSNTGQTVLCGFQHLPATTPDAACGTNCYDTESYGCCNGSNTIFQLSDASVSCANFTDLVSCGGFQCLQGWACCGATCYDPSAFACVTSTNNAQVICNNNGEAACGDVCYSPSTATCCNGVIFNINDENACGSQTVVTNNNGGYRGYNGNSGYFYNYNAASSTTVSALVILATVAAAFMA